MRAPESSSCGSMPTAWRKRFAEPLSTTMSGLAKAAKTRTGRATTFAVGSGAEMPRNCGSSSPKTMENPVASTSAMPLETASTAPSERPSAVSGPETRLPMEGCAKAPTMSVVIVMPTCAADSCVESWVTDWSTTRALESPSSMARWTVGRSIATSENSAATKTAVPTVSRTAASSSSHSVIAAADRRRVRRDRRRSSSPTIGSTRPYAVSRSAFRGRPVWLSWPVRIDPTTSEKESTRGCRRR